MVCLHTGSVGRAPARGVYVCVCTGSVGRAVGVKCGLSGTGVCGAGLVPGGSFQYQLGRDPSSKGSGLRCGCAQDWQSEAQCQVLGECSGRASPTPGCPPF